MGDEDARYSVALCTYRGARHVREQLASIFEARPACTELIVVDDASGDDTPDVVRRAIDAWQGHALVEINPVNRGSLRSFEQALSLTTESIVFLTDQDDRWHPDKPTRMLAQFATRPNLLLLHTDARIVDDAMQPLGYTLFRAIEASTRERATIRHGDAFDVFVRRNIATGATIAMRRSLLEAALPIPDGWVHDEWLATIASAIGKVDFLDAALIDYRQHANNQIGARKLSLGDKIVKSFEKPGDYYVGQLRRTTTLLDRLNALGPRVPPDRLVKVRAKLMHLQVRAALPTNRLARLRPIVREWMRGGYRRYSTGMKSLVRDLLHGA